MRTKTELVPLPEAAARCGVTHWIAWATVHGAGVTMERRGKAGGRIYVALSELREALRVRTRAMAA
jgi:hypothetical protein